MPVFNYDKLSKTAKVAMALAITDECDEETSKAIMKRLEDMGGLHIDTKNCKVGDAPVKKSTKTGGRINSWIVFKKKMSEKGMKDPKEVSELWKSMDEDDKAEYVKIAEDINKRNLSKDSSDDGSNKGSDDDDTDEDAKGTGIKKDKKDKKKKDDKDNKDKKDKKVKKDSQSDKPSDGDIPPPHPNGAHAKNKKLAKKKKDDSSSDDESDDTDTDNED